MATRLQPTRSSPAPLLPSSALQQQQQQRWKSQSATGTEFSDRTEDAIVTTPRARTLREINTRRSSLPNLVAGRSSETPRRRSSAASPSSSAGGKPGGWVEKLWAAVTGGSGGSGGGSLHEQPPTPSSSRRAGGAAAAGWRNRSSASCGSDNEDADALFDWALSNKETTGGTDQKKQPAAPRPQQQSSGGSRRRLSVPALFGYSSNQVAPEQDAPLPSPEPPAAAPPQGKDRAPRRFSTARSTEGAKNGGGSCGSIHSNNNTFGVSSAAD